MHFYPFNIKDYRKETRHLTNNEHYIYRSLLDELYLSEEPIECNINQIKRILCLTKNDDESLNNVLSDFFIVTDGFITHKRVELEISKISTIKKQASNAGKASAKARKQKQRPFNDRSTTVQQNHVSVEPPKTQDPIPNTQDPIKPNSENIKNVPTRNRTPINKIIEKWNIFAKKNNLPLTVKKTAKIEGQIRKMWIEDLTELNHWDNYIDYISKSKFLMGKAEVQGNRRTFRATLEWITNQTNYAKIAAGQYHE